MSDDTSKMACGGLLSSPDFLKYVVTTEDDLFIQYKKLFEERNWKGIKTLGRNGRNKNKISYEDKFAINPFSNLNLTPFSYDLSIGNSIYSIQKSDVGIKPFDQEQSIYELEPHETVIIITKEWIAIPHCYAATVWPRFNMVRLGIFQSMVKIDPTWHGHLAVAISNLSPATISLKKNDKFGTLLLYRLSSRTDVDLWKPEELEDADVELNYINLDLLNNWINKNKLQNVFNLAKDSSGKDILKIKGLKNSHLDSLSKLSTDINWLNFVKKEMANAWANQRHSKTGNRMIGMEALGMTNLNEIVKGIEGGIRVNSDDICQDICREDELTTIAEQFGKPFDAVAKIPRSVIKRIETELAPRLEANIENGIQLRVITLMFSVLGFLSLIIAVIAFLIKQEFLDLPASISYSSPFFWAIISVGTVTVLVMAFLIFHHNSLHRQSLRSIPDKSLYDEMKIIKKSISNLREEIHSNKSSFPNKRNE